MSDLTSFLGSFKRNYSEGSDVLKVQQNLKASFWGTIGVSPLKPSAQGIYNPVIMSGNENGGAIAEKEGFQTPGSVDPVQPTISAKLVVWPFEVTGSLIRQSETSKVAFARGLDAQQKDNLGRMYSDLNRQAWGTGTGQITLANGAGVATASLVVDDPFQFRKGMKIDAYASIGGAKEIDGIEVTAINRSTSTLTLASVQTWSDNAVIVKKNILNGVTAPNYKEIMGWRGIADTTTFSTTFQGVAVSSYGDWTGNVVDAASAPVSQDLLQRTYNRAPIIGGEIPNKLCSNYGQARTFLNTEIQKTRYEPGKVEGGNTVLKWGPLEWMVDHTYPIGEIGMMRSEGIQKYQTKDVHLSSLSGQGLYQNVGFDSIGGYYAYEGNIGVWKRNDQCRLTTLPEPTF